MAATTTTATETTTTATETTKTATEKHNDTAPKTLGQHGKLDTRSVDDNTSPDADEPSKEGDGGSGGGEELKATSGDLTIDSSGVGIHTLKKKQRAERFGMPVQLSEQEKRSSRAERFGTGPGLQESDTVKKSEENKRKARAERFGLEKSVPAVEEDKKKARLARFAPVSKTDPVEEDKKKARALRFSGTSNSPSHTNGKGIELKTAVTNEAGGGT